MKRDHNGLLHFYVSTSYNYTDDYSQIFYPISPLHIDFCLLTPGLDKTLQQ